MNSYTVYIPTKIYVSIKVNANNSDDAIKAAREKYASDGSDAIIASLDKDDLILDFDEADAERWASAEEWSRDV